MGKAFHNKKDPGMTHARMVESDTPDYFGRRKGIVNKGIMNKGIVITESDPALLRLASHRHKSLHTWQRGFDDIDYAFPGQKSRN